MPTWMALSFQDPGSPLMEAILFFHDHATIVLISITILTFHLIISLMVSKKFNKYIMEGQEIETFWTFAPTFLLIFIALPSMKTLYLMEDTKAPSLTVKISGHQWYWSYGYSVLSTNETENFMESSNVIRLIKTNEMFTVPVNFLTRTLITSEDVIHSWSMPSMGVKIDALPGRLNQTFLFPKRVGLFVGQCSEICGMNHSFMPILMKSMTAKEFLKSITKD